jgi:hypothetical protein
MRISYDESRLNIRQRSQRRRACPVSIDIEKLDIWHKWYILCPTLRAFCKSPDWALTKGLNAPEAGTQEGRFRM